MMDENNASSAGISSKNDKKSTAKSNLQSFPQKNEKGKPVYGTNNTTELLEKIPNKIVENKLDDVLDAVKTLDCTCDYPRCKVKTTLIGQDCNFCKKKFCFKHGLPEVHGCGEAIKRDERKKFLQPKPLKTIRHEQELSQAKSKLEAKLKDMQVSRMQKTAGAGNTRKKKK